MGARISFFAVEAGDDDDAFVAGLGVPATLLRALREDVAFRFVEIAREPPGEAPDATHTARYEVLREDGDVDGAGGTVFVEPFEVRSGGDEGFLAGWERVHDLHAAQPGYLGSRLYRGAGPTDFGFVAVARWSSPLLFARAAKRPEIHEAAAALPFASHPALYQVIG